MAVPSQPPVLEAPRVLRSALTRRRALDAHPASLRGTRTIGLRIGAKLDALQRVDHILKAVGQTDRPIPSDIHTQCSDPAGSLRHLSEPQAERRPIADRQ